ncbi:MAG: TRAM domain-containing protein [Candidatus Aenigmarchaeota archaeon]|nr:TRAM domain-containing protein [Candidatus Aenigmarchaeota archaeon]
MRFEGNRGSSGSGGFGGRRFGGGGFGRGNDSRDSRSDEPKPVKVGEEYDVEISETGSRGDGIARVNNFVVFVNGAKQGEKTKIRITDVRDRFAIGQKADAASAEQAVEGTDDMSEASDVTATEVKSAEGDVSEEGDEPADDAESTDEEDQ